MKPLPGEIYESSWRFRMNDARRTVSPVLVYRLKSMSKAIREGDSVSVARFFQSMFPPLSLLFYSWQIFVCLSLNSRSSRERVTREINRTNRKTSSLPSAVTLARRKREERRERTSERWDRSIVREEDWMARRAAKQMNVVAGPRD